MFRDIRVFLQEQMDRNLILIQALFLFFGSLTCEHPQAFPLHNVSYPDKLSRPDHTDSGDDCQM